MHLNDIPFFLGSFRARIQVSSIGRGCLIHPSLVLKSAQKIQLGDLVQVRRGVEFDARTNDDIGITIGNNCRIKEYCTIAAYGGKIVIGDNALIGRNATIFGHGLVEIGNHSMLGPNVSIFSSEHICTTASEPFQRQGFTREVTTVGKNVWLGAGVTILAGIRICPNVVVAAGSVVSSNINEAGIYGGVPAKRVADLSSKNDSQIDVFFVDWTLNG